MISLIAAIGSDREIGKRGRLPWPCLYSDRNWFNGRTRGKPVIMGRVTWQSIHARNRPLIDRHNIVLSGNPEFIKSEQTRILEDPHYRRHKTTVDVASSFDSALDIARHYGDEILIMGGQSLYDHFFPLADRLYLTEIQDSFPGSDRFFPEFNHRDWRRSSRFTTEEKDFEIYFTQLDRKPR